MPHHNVVPRSNGEKQPRLPESNKTSFFIGATRGWNQVVPTYSLKKFPEEGFFQFGDAGPLSFCGFRHIHCLARVMPGGCVKYRMHGTHCHQCHAREDEHQSILSPLVNAFPSPVSTSRIKSRSTPVSTCHQRSYQCKYRCNLRTSNATLAAELIPKPGAVRIVS